MKTTPNLKPFFSKIRKFGFFIPVSNAVVNHGARFLPQKALTALRNRRNARIADILSDVVAQANLQTESRECPAADYVPTVWVCWLQGERQMPPLVKLCYEMLLRNANGYRVVLLDEANIGEYADLPEAYRAYYKSGLIKPAHFSDLLRVRLLLQHGGLWIDSTILSNGPLPPTIFERDFFTLKTAPDARYISNCRWSSFFFACRPGNLLFSKLDLAFRLYLERTHVFVDYFLLDYLIDAFYNTDSRIRKMIDDVPRANPHLHSLQPLLCSPFSQTVKSILDSDTSFFKLSYKQFSFSQLTSNPGSTFNRLQELSENG